MSTLRDGSEATTSTLLPPSRLGYDGRSLSNTSTSKGPSYVRTGPGSFSSNLRFADAEGARQDYGSYTQYPDAQREAATSEQKQAEFRDKIEKETKIKIGSENMLEALNKKGVKQVREQRARVENELDHSNRKIAQLKSELDAEIQRSKERAPTPENRRLSFRSALNRVEKSQDEESEDDETESPTFVLSEILQALDTDAEQPAFYVERANALVTLLKRHPTLKYDIAWAVFGLRMQVMLLSGSREIVAAAYRVLRHAISDRASLKRIKDLQTDYFLILSLCKDAKANIEREQAVKFIRAFLDVNGGVYYISRGVIRILVAVAEHGDDRLRSICTLTLTEILMRDPARLVSAGGLSPLTNSMGDGTYRAPASIAAAFLHLLDKPNTRAYLRSGHELGVPFSAMVDAGITAWHEDRIKENAQVISMLFKDWVGLMALSQKNFLAVRSIISAVTIPNPPVRNILLELFFDVLRIKPPSWSSSFLAGRRLTTYGRVTNMKADTVVQPNKSAVQRESDDSVSLVNHYTAAVLAVLLRAGLVPALLQAERDPINETLKRKTVLLLGEMLRMASELLPPTWNAELQVLPELFLSAARFNLEDRFTAIGTIYQIDSVNRTLYRSAAGTKNTSSLNPETGEIALTARPQANQSKTQISSQIDEAAFRALMFDTQVLNTVNFIKWRWDLIQAIIEGPLLNPKRLDEAMRVTKFVHRLLSFLRPFKYRFSDIKNTKPNQRYVRAGCALMRTLLKHDEGVRYLEEDKFMRQLAECLAQLDRMSGITSSTPMFSPERLSETLVGGYFNMLGVLTSEMSGIRILSRWRIINMFYHIIELPSRDDLIKLLMSSLDYTLDNHPRIILTKAMTSCSKSVRIGATRLLAKYATEAIRPRFTSGADPLAGAPAWAIRLLVSQLYDPEIEVCEVAVKILEEACVQLPSLEYVVKCRPALDHLGAIAAPLLLRFLSTSVGYHYLDDLDYITREMDDWFLGRNDSYVSLVEASLARALADIPAAPGHPGGVSEIGPGATGAEMPSRTHGTVPPHFYRELARTAEGCALLAQKGHFDEFCQTIRDLADEDEDPEIILKVKGCLWAVGNVGSMELGAPFLEKSGIVADVVQIAEESTVMTVRGTAFFVLGLIGRSLHGQEILIECGWDSQADVRGRSLGYSLPLDFGKLFSIPGYPSQTPFAAIDGEDSSCAAPTDPNPQIARVLALVTQLSNTVLAKRAATELTTMKQKKAACFHDRTTFTRVMQIFRQRHIRLGAIRHVVDLFDRDMLRKIVLDEEGDESESESSDDGGRGGRADDSDDDSETPA